MMKTLYFNELCHKMKEIWYQMPTSYEGYIKRYDKKKDRSLKDLNKMIRKDLRDIKVTSDTIDQEVVDRLVGAVKSLPYQHWVCHLLRLKLSLKKNTSNTVKLL